MRYVTGVLSFLLAAAFLYFTFVSVSANSAPRGIGSSTTTVGVADRAGVVDQAQVDAADRGSSRN